MKKPSMPEPAIDLVPPEYLIDQLFNQNAASPEPQSASELDAVAARYRANKSSWHARLYQAVADRVRAV